MNKLSVGFYRTEINPMLGISVRGYFQERFAESILDDLTLSVLALSVEDSTVLMVAVDTCAVDTADSRRLQAAISQATGVPEDAIYLSASHTHTGPNLPKGLVEEYEQEEDSQPLVTRYFKFLKQRAADAAIMALADRKPARMGWGIGTAPNVSFVRRYRMKDGSVRTNPGVNNPDILHPIGDVDDRVSVVRFDREGAETIVLTHFANHPDTVGGSKISADWPGFLRETVEKTLDGVKCIFFNGAQGDINHVNVHPTGGYLNDMFMDFDDVARGYKHARYIGRVVAGGVLQAFDKVKYIDVDRIGWLKKTISVPAQIGDPSELEWAYRMDELFSAERYDEIPYTGMMLTTKIAQARRIIRLKDGPDAFTMDMYALHLGDVAFVGIPGEPFNGVGRALKATEGWELILPTCLTNGSEGYFPMQDSYDEGGYEAESSRFAAGVAERIIDGGVALLKEMEH